MTEVDRMVWEAYLGISMTATSGGVYHKTKKEELFTWAVDFVNDFVEMKNNGTSDGRESDKQRGASEEG